MDIVITRRRFTASAPCVLGGSLAMSGCSPGPAAESYEAVANRTWRLGGMDVVEGAALSQELVRCATLAPSSHNTQCWKFALEDKAITVLPDLSRRCPAVDPDDHHVFVSLGCAAENLIQAAAAHGLKAEPRFDASRDSVRVTLAPTPAQTSPLFEAMASRQCTRATQGESDKYARQIRSAAGIAVFVGAAADKAHWVDVGRCYERFALQATALGVRNAMLNQPVEVPSARLPFAAAIGLAGQRPDLVVRFGRGPTLPRSLRRPVQAVLV